MAGTIGDITINFDSHINKVVYSTVEWTRNFEWTTSGQKVGTAIIDGSTVEWTRSFEWTTNGGIG